MHAADDPNLLRNRPIGDRTAVISAGVLANMLLAFAICVTQVRCVLCCAALRCGLLSCAGHHAARFAICMTQVRTAVLCHALLCCAVLAKSPSALPALQPSCCTARSAARAHALPLLLAILRTPRTSCIPSTSCPYPCCTQASTVGIPEPVYRPGVRLGEIKAATVAAEAGLRQGDVVLRVGDLEVAPSPASVQNVVAKIRWAEWRCGSAPQRRGAVNGTLLQRKGAVNVLGGCYSGRFYARHGAAAGAGVARWPWLLSPLAAHRLAASVLAADTLSCPLPLDPQGQPGARAAADGAAGGRAAGDPGHPRTLAQGRHRPNRHPGGDQWWEAGPPGSAAARQCAACSCKTAGSLAQPTTLWLLDHPAVLPCLPALQLASNAEILRRTANGPVQAVVLATQEYAKLTGTVLKGESFDLSALTRRLACSAPLDAVHTAARLASWVCCAATAGAVC